MLGIMEMKRLKRNMVFDGGGLEEEDGVYHFKEEGFPVHYSNRTNLNSSGPRKFKVGKKKILSETLFGRETRKKTRVMHRLPN